MPEIITNTVNRQLPYRELLVIFVLETILLGGTLFIIARNFSVISYALMNQDKIELIKKVADTSFTESVSSLKTTSNKH